jgi:hypothetical protein
VQSGDQGKSWMARCPAHDDSTPSLHLTVDDHGDVLLYCHGGCNTEDVLKALRLRWPDLFSRNGNAEGKLHSPERGASGEPPEQSRAQSMPSGLEAFWPPSATVEAPPEGCTLVEYADAKGLDLEMLKGWGLFEKVSQRRTVVHMPYRNEAGETTAVRRRLSLKKGPQRFSWRENDVPILYGLWRLEEFRFPEIMLVEGESDCHTLWQHGMPALGVPGANNWKEEWASHLADFETIYVVIEPDQGGEAMRKKLAKSSIRTRLKLVDLGEYKDPNGLYLDDPMNFEARLQAALEEAVPWKEQEELEREAMRQEAWAQCEPLAKEPDILARFVEDLERFGVVGEDRAAKLLYLALTSRFFNRPVSAVVKGPSSAGKSYTSGQVLKFFPESTYLELSAMSEKALLYLTESLKHHFLVIFEAASLKDQDFQEYILRTLLSEGRIKYLTAMNARDNGGSELKELEGPTGLLMTTTNLSLHPENETRMLSIPVNDTQDQTRRVLLASADQALTGEDARETVDLTPWHALQTWLEKSEHRVVIPFAKVIAEQIKPVATRLRRDITLLWNLIRAHAVLHQARREKEESTGKVIATLEDYAAVRELVADVMAESVGIAVPLDVRATVEAVKALMESRPPSGTPPIGSIGFTYTQIGNQLGLDRTTAQRRVAKAQRQGYLVNKADKGKAAKIALGEDLRENVEVLPTVADVREAMMTTAKR